MKQAILCQLISYLCLISQNTWATSTVQDDSVRISSNLQVGYMIEDPPASFNEIKSEERKGIAVELFDTVTSSLDLTVDYIPYHSHKKALHDLEQQEISVLLGAYTHDPQYQKRGINHSPSFFIDEDVIITTKKEISVSNIIEMIWTDLLKNTLIISLGISLLFWALLYFFEGSKHEHLKHCTRTEKLSYTFFLFCSCFLRDLIYDPVTNAGRILMSLWMIISIMMMTVITSILTSTIILISADNAHTVQHASDLHLKRVGTLKGHHSTSFAVKMAGGKSVDYHELSRLLSGVENGEIPYAVVGKTMILDYLTMHPEYDSIVVTNTSVGYEHWVILYTTHLNQQLRQKIDKEIIHVIETGKLYPICAKYILHPEHCITM